MAKTSEFRISPPAGLEEIDVSSQRALSLYEIIRDDIISGRLKPNERLVVADLAEQLGTSTNPVREALQLLRGEGFVIFSPNRGARVRPIDQDFVRNIYEISALIEPALTRWFVGMATDADIAELERIERLIEQNNFVDPVLHSGLDVQFHTVMYQRHYNRHAAEIWWKHRQVLRAVNQRFNYTVARRGQVIRDHRELIGLVKAGDAEQAAAVVARHVEGSGRHLLELMRAYDAAKAG
ncbi:MAG: GntR family transcriptional regulator [Devosia sp. 67-54]|uniref:GntR family transcriptional regulator n=1 Tax=unclassified Devosia TaxID=196773 RepID=UPI00096933E6|nr:MULTISPECIES: GntR family transcriptional regulator [unclassified Devosia]MBN9307339.1 GntR family transcriptional regulator [Devosia sp.]OJX19746.1 MAG: GntR family transcriptional regulator [Devosia sp. 67-54]